jgi:hypothetical protein
MEKPTQHDAATEFDSIFALVNDESHAVVLAQSAEIAQRSAAIDQLRRITEQVEQPYIGTYLSL